MAAPYIAEIRIFSFDIVPVGWYQCNGQLLSIATGRELFGVIGTAYGGDGITTFALPDLMGRVPMHQSDGMPRGQHGGEAAHSLLFVEMPRHSHMANASSGPVDANTPQNNFWAGNTGFQPYGKTADVKMDVRALGDIGTGRPHENMAPYLTLNICIAVIGEIPKGF